MRLISAGTGPRDDDDAWDTAAPAATPREGGTAPEHLELGAGHPEALALRCELDLVVAVKRHHVSCDAEPLPTHTSPHFERCAAGLLLRREPQIRVLQDLLPCGLDRLQGLGPEPGSGLRHPLGGLQPGHGVTDGLRHVLILLSAAPLELPGEPFDLASLLRGDLSRFRFSRLPAPPRPPGERS